MSKIPKNINPFKLPENYFSGLSSEIAIKILEEKLIKKFGKKNPFIVPENYFLSSEEKIISRFKKTSNTKAFSLKSISPYISIAASLIIAFGIWQLFFNDINIKKTKRIISENAKRQNAKKAASVVTIKFNDALSNQIISSIDEATVIETINEKEDSCYNQINNEAAIEYIADYTDYEEIIALY